MSAERFGEVECSMENMLGNIKSDVMHPDAKIQQAVQFTRYRVSLQ